MFEEKIGISFFAERESRFQRLLEQIASRATNQT
jgi:hypothetical protein